MKHKIFACFIAAGIALPVLAAEKITSPAPPDRGWPRDYTVGDADIVVYQPQVEAWDNDVLKARFAVGIKANRAKEPVYGTCVFIADTVTNHETRTVTLFNTVIEDVKFPDADNPGATKYLEALLPERPVAMSLDRLLAEVPDDDIVTGNTPVTELKTDVPKLFLSTSPAMLVVFDGKPVFQPIAGTGLDAAVNTPSPVLRPSGKDSPTFLLTASNVWLTADQIDGDWKPASAAPVGLSKIPANHPLAAAKQGSVVSAKTPVPEVIVSEEPAELIAIDGRPKMRPIGNLPLLQISNSATPLFYHTDEGAYYALISGRWLTADKLDGTWSYVPYDALPEDFARIPEDDPAAFVLVSVPGTRDAAEAVKEAQIPEKAPVSRKTPPVVNVEYDGDPKFEPIEGTSMEYATNTSCDVIHVESNYYCCYNGVWFVATAPVRAAWVLATTIPRAIFGIPPRYPVYRCTFVRIYEVNDNYVVFGYTAGYRGVYIGPAGVVAFGTGYYYRPWVSASVYYGRSWTYGAGVVYRPYTGGFVAGAAWGSPGGVTVARAGYNPWTGNWGAGYRTSTPYASWGRGVVGNGDDWAEAGYYRNGRGGVAGIRNSEGDYAVVAHNRLRGTTVGVFNDDLYAAKNGEVVRRTDDGWQRYDDGQWNDVDRAGLRGDWEDRARSNTSSYKGADGNLYQRDNGSVRKLENGKWNNVNNGTAQDRRDAIVKERPRPAQLPASTKDRLAQKPAQLPANAKDRLEQNPVRKPAQLPANPKVPTQRPTTQPADRPTRDQLEQRIARPQPADRPEQSARQSNIQQAQERARGNQRTAQAQQRAAPQRTSTPSRPKPQPAARPAAPRRAGANAGRR